MKKILSPLLALSCYIIFLLLPILLGFHANFMNHHQMNMSECIEHCIESVVYLGDSKVVATSLGEQVLVLKIIFTKILEFTLPLIFLYTLICYSPPNWLRKIENYQYSDLVGIIKLTT